MQACDDYVAGKVADIQERHQHERKVSRQGLLDKTLDTSFRLIEQIHARVAAIVEDPKTAATLEPC